ncbi:hypothetical protein ACFL5Z_04815 [Planctomycetota bacterium]
MDPNDQDFKSFLRDIATQVDSLIHNKNGKSLFQKHIDNMFREAEEYRKYLHAEYKKASKKGFTESYDNKPKDCDCWHWYSTNKNTNEYFMDDNDLDFSSFPVCFWMKEQPKLDPLSYAYSMARGTTDRQHQNLALLDYQYFILACIHDCQRCAAGQTTIYFDPRAIALVLSGLEDCDFKTTICGNVYSTIYDLADETSAQTVQVTIQRALRDVEADCTSLQPQEKDREAGKMEESFHIWSRPYRNWLKNSKDGMYLVERVPKDWKSYDFKCFSRKEIGGPLIGLVWAISIQLSDIASSLESITLERLAEHSECDATITRVWDWLEKVEEQLKSDEQEGSDLESRIGAAQKKVNHALAKAELREIKKLQKSSNLIRMYYGAIKDWFPIIRKGTDLTFEIRLLAIKKFSENERGVYDIILKALGHLEALTFSGVQFVDSVVEREEKLFDGEEDEREEIISEKALYVLKIKETYDFARHISDARLRFVIDEVAFQLQAYCRTKGMAPEEATEKILSFLGAEEIEKETTPNDKPIKRDSDRQRFDLGGIVPRLIEARIKEEEDYKQSVVDKSEVRIITRKIIENAEEEFLTIETKAFLNRHIHELKGILEYIDGVHYFAEKHQWDPETIDLLKELIDWKSGSCDLVLDNEDVEETKITNLIIIGPVNHYIEKKSDVLSKLHALVVKKYNQYLMGEITTKTNYAFSSAVRSRLQLLMRQFEDGASKYPGLSNMVMSWPFMHLMPRPPKDKFPDFEFPRMREKKYSFDIMLTSPLVTSETLTNMWFKAKDEAGLNRFRALAEEAGQTVAEVVFDYKEPLWACDETYRKLWGIKKPCPPDVKYSFMFTHISQRFINLWFQAIHMLRRTLIYYDGWDGLFDEDSNFSDEGFHKGLYNFWESKDVFLDSALVCNMLLNNASMLPDLDSKETERTEINHTIQKELKFKLVHKALIKAMSEVLKDGNITEITRDALVRKTHYSVGSGNVNQAYIALKEWGIFTENGQNFTPQFQRFKENPPD